TLASGPYTCLELTQSSLIVLAKSFRFHSSPVIPSVVEGSRRATKSDMFNILSLVFSYDSQRLSVQRVTTIVGRLCYYRSQSCFCWKIFGVAIIHSIRLFCHVERSRNISCCPFPKS